MKVKIILPKRVTNTVFLLFVFNILTSAQTADTIKIQPPKIFLGVGLGVNDYGFGIGAEFNVYNNFWVYGNAGLSTWNGRLTTGITIYPKSNGYKSSFSFGYSYATSSEDFSANLEVEQPNSKPVMKEVLLDQNSVSTLNFKYSYNLKIGKKSKFVFSGGYSVLLTKTLYVNKSLYQLTEKSEDFIKLMAPGGIIVGITFMIGV